MEESGTSPGPDYAIARRRDGLDSKALQYRIALDAAIFEMHYSVLSADPEGAVGGFGQTRRVGHAGRNGERIEVPVPVAGEAVGSDDPDRLGMVLKDRPDGSREEAVPVAESRKLGAVAANEAVFGANPEIAAAVFKQAVDAGVRQTRGSLLVIDDELDSIEADQPTFSGQPNVTIPALNDRVDGVLRKADVGLPGAASILAKIFVRIETKRQAGGEREPRKQERASIARICQGSVEHPRLFPKAGLCPILDEFRGYKGRSKAVELKGFAIALLARQAVARPIAVRASASQVQRRLSCDQGRQRQSALHFQPQLRRECLGFCAELVS